MALSPVLPHLEVSILHHSYPLLNGRQLSGWLDVAGLFSLKCKVRYYEDEEEETRVRMHKMAIDKNK
jgi:hypothetical protein